MRILSNVFSFEGIEGCGKSTAILQVSNSLINDGHKVEVFREPGSTILGEKIRELILNDQSNKLPWTEFFLFLAARQELMEKKILPLMKEHPNTIVILDRYHDSSLAYQGAGRDLGIDKLLNVISNTTLNLWPAKRFYLEISLELSKQRQKERGGKTDYFESENEAFFQRTIKGYETIASLFPHSFHTIDARQPITQVTGHILQEIKKLL